MQLIKHLGGLVESNNLLAIDAELITIMQHVGCEKFSYNYYPTDFKFSGEIRHVLCTQQTEEWQIHYSNEHYDRVDPIFTRMRQSQLPLSWRVEEELTRYGSKQQQLFSDALDFGMRGGFAIPIHAPFGEFANLVVQDVGILDLIKRKPNIEHQLQLIAYHYHSRVSQLIENKKEINLTQREKECLQLTSQHKSAKEISMLLNISLRTVGFHIENAIKKLNVANKYQAVAKLTQRELWD